MMKSKYKLLAAGMLGLGLGIFSPVQADDEKEAETPDVKIFEQLDKDADGKLVADEIAEDKKRFFDQLMRDADSDKDGILSKQEYLTPPKQEEPTATLTPRGRYGEGNRPQMDVKQMFKRADKNGDGKLTVDELPERLAGRLKPLMEKAGKEELTQADLEKLMARRGGGGGPPGFGGPPEGPGGRMRGRPTPEMIFEAADTDGDGKIYLKDITDRGRMLVERAYDELGKEPDDSLTLDELKEVMPAIAGPAGPPPGGGPGGEFGRGQPGRGPFGRGPGGDPEMMEDGDGRHPPFGPPHLPKFFVMLDSDDDGQISEDEIKHFSTLFKELDENEDGYLDPHELLGPPPHERDEMSEGDDMPRRPTRPGKGPDSKPKMKKKKPTDDLPE